MRCKFRSDMTCYKILVDCLNCEINRNQRLENFSENNNVLNQEFILKKLKDNMFICPYCLHVDNIKNFMFVSSKTHKVLKVKRCIDCKNFMFIQTLEAVKNYSAVQFAKWIIDYPYFDFWKKANRDKFIERSKRMKDLNIFWDTYHECKGRLKTGLH